MLKKWCCCWSVDVGGVVLVVGGCGKSGVVGGRWLLEEWCCWWLVDVEGVFLFLEEWCC